MPLGLRKLLGLKPRSSDAAEVKAEVPKPQGAPIVWVSAGHATMSPPLLESTPAKVPQAAHLKDLLPNGEPAKVFQANSSSELPRVPENSVSAPPTFDERPQTFGSDGTKTFGSDVTNDELFFPQPQPWNPKEYRDKIMSAEASRPPGLRAAPGAPAVSASSVPAPAAALASAESRHTTVMLRNIPNDYLRDQLLDVIDKEGFRGSYDFMYLPVDLRRKAGKGYAFINFVSNEQALRFKGHFQGWSAWHKNSQKQAETTWGQNQGLQHHIDTYRNSPFMHPEADDAFKAAVFRGGHRVDFPAPTKRVRAPRPERDKGAAAESASVAGSEALAAAARWASPPTVSVLASPVGAGKKKAAVEIAPEVHDASRLLLYRDDEEDDEEAEGFLVPPLQDLEGSYPQHIDINTSWATNSFGSDYGGMYGAPSQNPALAAFVGSTGVPHDASFISSFGSDKMFELRDEEYKRNLQQSTLQQISEAPAGMGGFSGAPPDAAAGCEAMAQYFQQMADYMRSAAAQQRSVEQQLQDYGDFDTHACVSSGPTVPESELTTVMLRNIPNDYLRNDLLQLLDEQSFTNCYDFVYLPVDFKRKAGLGYAFINLVDHTQALRFKSHFKGFNTWKVGSTKECVTEWGRPDQQGLDHHIFRYRNSPLMHSDVPDEFKAALFKDGLRIAFPKPTKKIKAPRRHFQEAVGAPAAGAPAAEA
mmetsp:Transcript_101253/g.325371  ORF Transcript_101253/g.325371 Transcript_101253/m.325371 type:complete len:702 (+) Transcript_101253:49-2154(+)